MQVEGCRLRNTREADGCFEDVDLLLFREVEVPGHLHMERKTAGEEYRLRNAGEGTQVEEYRLRNTGGREEGPPCARAPHTVQRATERMAPMSRGR
jgi:hypothetical protein